MIMKVAAALVREKFAGFTAELIFLGLHSIILITVYMVTGIIFRVKLINLSILVGEGSTLVGFLFSSTVLFFIFCSALVFSQ